MMANNDCDEESMRVVPPSDSDDEQLETLRIIRTIGRKILPKRWVRNFLDEVMEQGVDDSVRRIQGERYEIFFHDAVDKGTSCIDTILQRSGFDPTATRQRIVDYAIAQAYRDDRLQGQDHKFGNFSLIVTYDAAEAQAPHVDLLQPNHQFGMLMTEGPGTMWYDIPNKVKTVEDLKAAWERTDKVDQELGFHVDPLPEKLIEAMKLSKDVQSLLRGYGDVLVSDEEMAASAKCLQNLPAGSLLSLPGSVVHAGPRSEHFRAVLFFSAWPRDNQSIAEYHPDIQFSSVFLCGRIIQLTWRQCHMGYQERKYLLEKLRRYIRQGGSTPKDKRINREWAGHFQNWDLFVSFIALLEQDMSSRESDMELIAKTAQNGTLCFYNVQGSQDGSLVGDFVKVSAAGLVAEWDQRFYEVQVYERPTDGKVILYYPKDDSLIGHSWEGVESDENYRLKRPDGALPAAARAEGWFDGTNGVLLDKDGEPIHCSVPLNDGSHISEFSLVSAPGLVVPRGKRTCELFIYHRPQDGKVIICIPKKKGGHRWRGTEPELRFQLVRFGKDHPPCNGSKDAWFDGSNGELLSPAGDVINCFVEAKDVDSENCAPPLLHGTTSIVKHGSTPHNEMPSLGKRPAQSCGHQVVKRIRIMLKPSPRGAS